MHASHHTIVCLSSQGWDDGMWTNKQHVMSRLAKHHRVLYVSFAPLPASHLLRRKWRARQLPRFSAPHRSLLTPLVSEHDGVTVLEFWSPELKGVQPHQRRWRWSRFDLRVRLLQRYLREQNIQPSIVWVYHPGYGTVARQLPHNLLVYDCVDEYSAFPEYAAQPAWLRQRERQLIQRADLVFTTSRGLYETKRPLNPDATHLVHNVGDAEHFAAARDTHTDLPADIAGLPSPRVVFVGAVSNYKLNVDWLVALARAEPDWSIVIIGPEGVGEPDTQVQPLYQQANIQRLGHRPYSTLPAYLKAADVVVIPYRLNDYTRCVFPIKFFELMATGKPVVISRLPALSDYYDDTLVADTAEDFVALCRQAVAHPHEGRQQRITLADANSWSARVGRLWALCEAQLQARKGAPKLTHLT